MDITILILIIICSLNALCGIIGAISKLGALIAKHKLKRDLKEKKLFEELRNKYDKK